MVNNPSWPYFLGGFAFVIGKFNPHPLENIHVPSFIAGIYISALYFLGFGLQRYNTDQYGDNPNTHHVYIYRDIYIYE